MSDMNEGQMGETSDRSLAELTAAYRAAGKALENAREALAAGIKREYTSGGPDGKGRRIADIVRDIDHEWTREYVSKVAKS